MQKFTKTFIFNGENSLPVHHASEKTNFSNALILKEIHDEIDGYQTSFQFLLSYQFNPDERKKSVKFMVDVDSKWATDIEFSFVLKQNEQRIVFDKKETLQDGQTSEQYTKINDGIYKVHGFIKYSITIDTAEEIAISLRKVIRTNNKNFDVWLPKVAAYQNILNFFYVHQSDVMTHHNSLIYRN